MTNNITIDFMVKVHDYLFGNLIFQNGKLLLVCQTGEVFQSAIISDSEILHIIKEHNFTPKGVSDSLIYLLHIDSDDVLIALQNNTSGFWQTKIGQRYFDTTLETHLTTRYLKETATTATATAATSTAATATAATGSVEWILHFDGCSKGNPGNAGIGYVVYQNGAEIAFGCDYIGQKTNNESEYTALITGLTKLLQLVEQQIIKLHDKILVRGDSLLVINQMTGKFAVKEEKLKSLYQNACDLSSNFQNITFEHVFRQYNKRADALSNMGLLHK